MVIKLREWVDNQYDEGRETMISDEELVELIDGIAPGRFD